MRLDLQSATIAAAALLVLALTIRPFRRRWSMWLGAAAMETAVVCTLFALWQLANRVTHTHTAGGLANGRWVWHMERAVHFPSEASLQKLILGHPDLVRASNYYYATAHLTGMAVFLVWLWLRHRDRYPQWRNIVAIFTGIALLIEMIPVAPPRLIGGTGLVDTAQVYGQSVYAAIGSGVADQYAALPSIHAGWALIIAIACVTCSRSPWRWIGVLHGVLTMFVIVATANHYWFDGFAAAVIFAFAWLIQRALARALPFGQQAAVTPEPASTQSEPAPV